MPTQQTVPVITYEPIPVLKAKKVGPAHVGQWLAAGWQTFRRMPGPSLSFGALFAVSGLLITLAAFAKPQFVFAFWSGFLLVGPILAMFAYRMAKREEQGDLPSFSSCRRLITASPGTSMLFALLLAVVMIAWIRISTLIVALYAGNLAGGTSFITQVGSPEWLGFVATLFAVGGVFALAMFGLTAWSMPMMADGRANLVTAIASSVRTVARQPLLALTWGLAISALTLLGMATMFIGFVVIFPVLGYATWHAYRDLFD